MKPYLIEAVGSGVYTYLVISAISSGTDFNIPLLEALLFGLIVYLAYSKKNLVFINPAIALAAWAVNLIGLKETGKIIVAQSVGSLVALLLGVALLGSNPQIIINFGSSVFVAELIGMTIFGFGMAAILFNKVTADLVGHVAAVSLFTGMMIAHFSGSSAIFNPFVAYAIGSLTPEYFLAAIFGAIAGVTAYKHLLSEK